MSAWTLAICLLAWVPAMAGGDCTKTSVGLVPLIDMGSAIYQGFEGGLYPAASSTRPAPHDVDADTFTRVALLDPNGIPDAATGRIVLLTVGMSNTSIESMRFIPLANADPSRNNRLVLVNGAQGGWSADRVADPNQNAPFWSTIQSRLAAAGVTPMQVEVIWLKEADRMPTRPFPQHAQQLQAELGEISRIIKALYPNARQIYTTSRIYAGYATSSLNPEPYAYESGFSVKWLVEDQLAGQPGLNFRLDRGPVVAPWLSWGPYVWADGTTPRSDGLTWECADLQNDGTHPSTSGADKVARALLSFFQSDPIASRWYEDCDPNNPAVFSAPPRVLELDVGLDPVSGSVELRWESLAPVSGQGTRYDLVGGLAGDLRPSGGFAGATCLLADLPASSGPDPVPDPPPGEVVYYLVRGRNSCGAGTYGEPEALPGPRAALDSSSPCPSN